MNSRDSVKTPIKIINELKQRYFKFEAYYDPTPYVKVFDKNKHKNGLKTAWLSPSYCNPPYSRAAFFVEKAWKEYKKGIKSILLVKNSVLSTKKFTEVKDDCCILFFNSKIKFVGFSQPAHFSSVLIMFGFGKKDTFNVFEY